jgi:Amiloride-sensitive sodium channel
MPTEFDVFFLKNYFFKLVKKQQVSNTDFLGLIGGFLGLFFGCSMLSLIEIPYFLFFQKCYSRKISTTFLMSRENRTSFLTYVCTMLQETSFHGLNLIILKNGNIIHK